MDGYGMDGQGLREQKCGRDLGGENEPDTVSELLICFKHCPRSTWLQKRREEKEREEI